MKSLGSVTCEIPLQYVLFNSRQLIKNNEHKGFHMFLGGIISTSLQKFKFIEGK